MKFHLFTVIELNLNSIVFELEIAI